MTAQPEDGQAALADRPPAQQAWCQGRIPLHLRVGVTGHRYLDSNDPALVTAVRENLKLIESRCRKGTAATPVSLAVVSALAEGADRIVAREGIGRGASLEVVLPLPLDDYLTDFTSDTSRSEFCTLLVDHASAITELPAAVREEAYERAGRVIVDRSDVLLALWTGEPARGGPEQGGRQPTRMDQQAGRGPPLDAQLAVVHREVRVPLNAVGVRPERVADDRATLVRTVRAVSADREVGHG